MLKRIAAAWATAYFLLCPYAMATPGGGAEATAQLTEAHGSIFKRGFVDWTKEQWGDPEPAKLGDLLHEGMQLGTGDKSWAQVAWRNVKTRAWANTVFAIAPHQKLVYLLGGEMLFQLDKHRKDKNDYVVWTKVLQARIRGTTVLVQADKDVSRITVLEGCVEVMNRLDHSVIKILPGVVYEIRTRPAPGTGPNAGRQENLAPDAMAQPRRPNAAERTFLPKDAPHGDRPVGYMGNGGAGAQDNGGIEPQGNVITEPQGNTITEPEGNGDPSPQQSRLPNIAVNEQPPIAVFETRKSSTSLLLANAGILQTHPLVAQFDTALPSLPLVDASLKKLPPICHIGELNGSGTANNFAANAIKALPDAQQAEKVLLHQATITRVPTTLQYKVGPEVGRTVVVPAESISLFPPAGFIGQPTNMMPGNAFMQGAGTNPVAGRITHTTRVPMDKQNNGPMQAIDPMRNLPPFANGGLIGPQSRFANMGNPMNIPNPINAMQNLLPGAGIMPPQMLPPGDAKLPLPNMTGFPFPPPPNGNPLPPLMPPPKFNAIAPFFPPPINGGH